MTKKKIARKQDVRKQKPTPAARGKKKSKRASRSKPLRIFAAIGSVSLLCLMGYGGLRLFRGVATTVQSEKPQVSLDELTQQAQTAFDAEQHEDVLDILQPHLGLILEERDPATLKLLAMSRLTVPMKNNRHVGIATGLLRQVVAIDRDDFKSLSRLFRLCGIAGQTRDAVDFGRRAIELRPNDPELKIQLGNLLLNTDQTPAAIELADEILKAHPEEISGLCLSIRCMASAGKPQEEIHEFVRTHAEQSANPDIARRQMLLAYANETNNDGLRNSLLDDVDIRAKRDQVSAQSLAAQLEQQGRSTEALIVLKNSGVAANADDLSVLSRNYMLGRYDEIFEQPVDVGKLDEQALIVRCMAAWTSGRTDDLKTLSAELSNRETRMTRIWGPVVAGLQAQLSSVDLLPKVDAALNVYPRSHYLLFIRARVLSALEENDLAVANYRAALQFTPTWSLLRREVAQIHMARSEFDIALGHLAIVLRSNPFDTVAVEGTIISCLESLNQKQTPFGLDATRDFLKTQLKLDHPQKTLDVFQAVLDRLNGDQTAVDAFVRSRIAAGDINEYGILKRLGPSESTLAALDSLKARTSGYSVDQLIELAAEADDPQAFLESSRQNGTELTELTKQFVLAISLERAQAPEAKDAWTALLKQYPGKAKILRRAIRSFSFQDDLAERADMLEALRKLLPENSLVCTLEACRLELDAKQDQKSAAKVVLKLTKAVRTSPNSEAALRLLAIAFGRLDRPDKMIGVLEKALEQGFHRSEYHLQLAELYQKLHKPQPAIKYARLVVAPDNQNIAQRRRAIGVLMKQRDFDTAFRASARELNPQLVDSDVDFGLAGIWVIAGCRTGNASKVMPRIEELSAQHERWMILWLNAASLPEVPFDEREGLLNTANRFMENSSAPYHGDDKILRLLAARWRSLSAQSGKEQHLQTAQAILKQVGTRTVKDLLMLALVDDKLRHDESAVSGYQQVVAHADANKEIRSVALNNLGLIEFRRGNPSQALKLIKQAIHEAARPVFVESLVDVLLAQQDEEQAIGVLRDARKRWPADEKISQRLGELLAKKVRTAEAPAGQSARP